MAKVLPHDTLGAGSDARLFAPATARNREAILAVLSRVLPSRGLVLEVGSGSGEHAVYFARRLPGLVWQPSDPDPQSRRSIAAHGQAAGCANLRPPLDLDSAAPDWPIAEADAMVCINMVHIAAWAAAEGLLAGAARLLPDGGRLYLYGPYTRGGAHTAPSNARFDAALRRDNPAWGLRDLEAVADAAAAHGLRLEELVEMPANNLSLILRRSAAARVTGESP